MEGFKVVEKSPNIIWVNKESLEERIDCNPYKVNYLEYEKMINENTSYQTIEELIRSQKDLTGGATPLGANYLDKGVRFIRTQNVGRNYIDLKDVVYISEEDNEKLKRSILQEDDVLLTITGSDFGRIATVTKESLPANINQHSVRMHFKKHMDPFYVAVFLNSLYGQSQIFRYSVGATRPAIDYSAIKKIKIPITSPEIQKYIGDKVRKAEKLGEEVNNFRKQLNNDFLSLIGINDKLEYKDEKYIWIGDNNLTSISLTPEYYKSKYMKIENIICESIYKSETIEEICKMVDEGSTPADKHPKQYFDEGELFIRGGNIDRNVINFEEVARITTKDYKLLPKGPFYGGDVLLTMRGNFGFSAVVPESITEFKVNPTIAVLRPKDYINKYYLAAYLNSQICRIQMDRIGQTSTRPQLNLSEVKTIKVIIPPINLQEEIAKKVKIYIDKQQMSKQLILEAKKDVEDLIEGNFDMSKLNQS